MESYRNFNRSWWIIGALTLGLYWYMNRGKAGGTFALPVWLKDYLPIGDRDAARARRYLRSRGDATAVSSPS